MRRESTFDGRGCGRVIARTSVPRYAHMSMDGTFFRIHHTELGIVEIEAFRIELEGFDDP